MENPGTLKQSLPYVGILFASAALLFLPFLGATHLFDWDEINFAESAREMIVTGNYSRVMIDYQPFWEKPPLFFWIETVSMHLFGVNEFAARFPNAMMGIVTAVTLFFLGRSMKGPRFGFIWGLIYISTVIPHVYFKSGVIDPTFNYFIFLSVYFWYKSHEGTLFNRSKEENTTSRNTFVPSMLAGILAGLATLAKGPVSLLLIGAATLFFWIFSRTTKVISVRNIFVFGFFYVIIASLWFGVEVINNGPSFLTEFITYQIELFSQPVAGHGQPFYYHFVVVFIGCFPISVLALPVMFRRGEGTDRFLLWMKILFWVVMILFSIVTTKIVHYSSQSYFPLSFMAASYVYELLSGVAIRKGILRTLMVLGILLSSLLMVAPILILMKDKFIPLIRDPFAVGNLSVDVPWTGLEGFLGLIWLVAIILACRDLKNQNVWRGFLTLCYGTCVCLFLYIALVVPKVERYSQGTAIQFYEDLAGKDVYIKTLGFKSYGPFFYARKMPGERPEARNEDWLISGPIDKPAYFVTKVTTRDYLKDHPEIRLIKEEGGFLFYERLPEQ